MGFKLSDNFGPLRKNWIKGAIKRPGAFRKKAEELGVGDIGAFNKAINDLLDDVFKADFERTGGKID